MNRPILLSAASLLILLLGGCSKSPSPAPDDPQKGAIVFNSSVSPEVAVAAGSDTKAAATRTLPASCLPGPEQMKLKLTASSGPTFEMNYESMVDYDQPLLDPGSYTAKFMYGDPATEGPDEAYFEGTVTCTIVARKTVTQEVTHNAGQFGLHAAPLRLVQELLHLLQPDRLHRIGLPERSHAGSGPESHADFRPREHQALPQREGDQNQRRGGGISQNADRHHRSPHLAQHRNRRRIGRTGEPRPALRRHAHHGRNPGDRTEPRSITTPNIHRNPKYDSI